MEKEQTKPWIEDAGVDPLLRQTIAAARNEAPDSASLERVTAGVLANIGPGLLGPAEGAQGPAANGTPSAATGGSPSAAASAGQLGMAKLATVAVLFCGLSVVIGKQVFDKSDGDRSTASAARQLDTTHKATRAATVPKPIKPKSDEPKALVASGETTSEPALKSKSSKPPMHDAERHLANELESNPAEEIRLLRRAKRALSSAPDEALRLTREHERRFGQGKFAQEREALAIEALHEMGHRAEALRSLDLFKRRWPGSVYLRRVEERLGVSRQQSD